MGRVSLPVIVRRRIRAGKLCRRLHSGRFPGSTRHGGRAHRPADGSTEAGSEEVRSSMCRWLPPVRRNSVRRWAACCPIRITWDKSPPVKTATDARQGRMMCIVRWVLGISLTLAIVAMIIAFFVS